VAGNTPAGGGGVEIALRTMRKAHRLGATWDLLLDPVTVCFVAGAGVMIVLARGRKTPDESGAMCGGSCKGWSLGVLLACVLVWVPVRVGILMAVVMHRALRTDFDAPLRVMDAFVSTWVLLILVLPLAAMGWRFVRVEGEDQGQTRLPMAHGEGTGRVLRLVAPATVALAVALLTIAVVYDPVGVRKAGRVVVDEYHSKWEPTTRPFDTTWYGHDSGYNYAAIYDYSSRFYDMSRLTGPIDDAALAKCDVFILKCPTSRLQVEEVERLRKFVENGGGLLLVGEHTDVFGLGTNLNDVARPFGFQFRYDMLFNIDEEHPFDYLYEKPLVPHPIVQRMPPLDFEGPCTLAPTGHLWGPGRAVMTALGQRDEPAHYYASNFMPPPEDRADSRYGAWVVAWATKYGKGRVVAHCDSTQWSNFSAFEPGKPQSWLGMIEWLNRRDTGMGNPRGLWGVVGIVLFGVAVGLVVLGGRPSPRPSPGVPGEGEKARTEPRPPGGEKARTEPRPPGGEKARTEPRPPGVGGGAGIGLVLVAAGLLGFAVAVIGVRAHDLAAMPAPQRVPGRRMVNVGIDRTISQGYVSKGGFIGGRNDGYAIFERWILRLGWFTDRENGRELLDRGNDLVVFLLPGKDVSDAFRQQVVDYVKQGGRVLVIDTPEHAGSTANSLLRPFGLNLRRPMTDLTGEVAWTIGLPGVPGAGVAYEVTGGDETLATMMGRPVAATVRFGKGSVTAVGFGSRFSDANMGVTGDVEPNEELLKVYDGEYGLLRHLMGMGVKVARPTTQGTTDQGKTP
jgi:hypothetical protein